MTTTYDELRAKYGLIPEAKVGINEDGEEVIIYIDEECASLRTMQKNSRFMRVNVYHKDGTNEEYFEH